MGKGLKVGLITLFLLLGTTSSFANWPPPSSGYIALTGMLAEDSTCLDKFNADALIWLMVMNSDTADSLESEIFQFRMYGLNDASIHPEQRKAFLDGLRWNRSEEDAVDTVEAYVVNDTFSITSALVLASWSEWNLCLDTLIQNGIFQPLVAYQYPSADSLLADIAEYHDNPAYRMKAALCHDYIDTVNTVAQKVAENILDSYVANQETWSGDSLELSSAIEQAYDAIGSEESVVQNYINNGISDNRYSVKLWSMAKLESMAVQDSSTAAIELLVDLMTSGSDETIRERASFIYWLATDIQYEQHERSGQ